MNRPELDLITEHLLTLRLKKKPFIDPTYLIKTVFYCSFVQLYLKKYKCTAITGHFILISSVSESLLTSGFLERPRGFSASLTITSFPSRSWAPLHRLLAPLPPRSPSRWPRTLPSQILKMDRRYKVKSLVCGIWLTCTERIGGFETCSFIVLLFGFFSRQLLLFQLLPKHKLKKKFIYFFKRFKYMIQRALCRLSDLSTL